VLVAATHTHSGGPLEGIRPGDYDAAPELIRKLATEQSIMESPEYVRLVHKALVEAVVEADQRRVPARACAGSGWEARVSFNRRFHMKNGLSSYRSVKNMIDWWIDFLAGSVARGCQLAKSFIENNGHGRCEV